MGQDAAASARLLAGWLLGPLLQWVCRQGAREGGHSARGGVQGAGRLCRQGWHAEARDRLGCRHVHDLGDLGEGREAQHGFDCGGWRMQLLGDRVPAMHAGLLQHCSHRGGLRRQDWVAGPKIAAVGRSYLLQQATSGQDTPQQRHVGHVARMACAARLVSVVLLTSRHDTLCKIVGLSAKLAVKSGRR